MLITLFPYLFIPLNYRSVTHRAAMEFDGFTSDNVETLQFKQKVGK